MFFLVITFQSFGQVILQNWLIQTTAQQQDVELYNAGSSDFDLTGYELIRWSNGNADPQTSGVDLSLMGLLAAGSFIIVAADSTEFNAASSIESSSTQIESNLNVWADDFVAGCTNHTEQALDTPGIFDPGKWIGKNNSCAVSYGLATYACNSTAVGDNNDAVTVNLPFGVNNTIVNVTATNGT